MATAPAPRLSVRPRPLDKKPNKSGKRRLAGIQAVVAQLGRARRAHRVRLAAIGAPGLAKAPVAARLAAALACLGIAASNHTRPLSYADRPQGRGDHTLRPLHAPHTRPQAIARPFRGVHTSCGRTAEGCPSPAAPGAYPSRARSLGALSSDGAARLSTGPAGKPLSEV